MAENETAGAAPAAATPAPIKMQVLGQFIRDLSFENIVAQKGVNGEVQPEIQVQVGLDAKKRTPEHQYEIILKLNISSKTKGGDATLFLMEIEYGGVFHIENVPEEQMHPFLMIECPRMLFPYVRRIVGDITHDGGFPQLNLDNIDFIQLYRNQLAQRQAQQKAPEGAKLS